MEPREYFSKRIALFEKERYRLEKSNSLISVLRVVCFVVCLILAVIFANEGIETAVISISLLFLVLFATLLKKHARIRVELRRATNLERINREEIDRLEFRWEHFDACNERIDKAHAYTYDLDIFGKNSLFQLLNRTVTPRGRETLADWLSQPAKAAVVQDRQQAVAELEPDQDWNQEIQAAGRMTEAGKKDLETLTGWLDTLTETPGKAYITFAFLSPVVLAAVLIITIMGMIPIYWLIALLVVNGFILRKFQEQVHRITQATSGGVKLLGAYGSIIRLIEGRTFDCTMLRELRSPFDRDGYSASREIGKLGRLLDFLNGRGNLFYASFNLALLTDIHLVHRAARWKQQNQEDMSLWFDHIAAMESLISLASYSRANPDYVNPIITEEYLLSARGLGHPLLPPSRRVTNDFKISREGTINLITGSNMSGKSTFLRTLGINVVLALAGAKVPAAFFSLREVQVFTGMRSEDNLEENISSFYAELKRIRKLLDTIEMSDRPVFYMLDEILKGTNTHDRHKGSEALIRRLAGGHSAGLISTHDLELGRLADEKPEVLNYSFNSRIEANEIIFDYKIEPGLCHSFNASKLMEKLGILNAGEHSTK